MINGILRGLLLLYVDNWFHFGESKKHKESMDEIFDTFEISPKKRQPGSFNFLKPTVTQLDDMSFRQARVLR